MGEILDKAKKRFTIYKNRIKGSNAEKKFVAGEVIKGNKIERTGRGHDYKLTEIKYNSNKTRKTTKIKYIEIKSSKTAPLSPLQKKTMKRMKNYEVRRDK